MAKSVFMPLATDAAIHNKTFRSDMHPLDLALHTTSIISNEEMNDIIKIVKSLEESDLLIKGVNEKLKMKENNKKEDFSECY